MAVVLSGSEKPSYSLPRQVVSLTPKQRPVQNTKTHSSTASLIEKVFSKATAAVTVTLVSLP